MHTYTRISIFKPVPEVLDLVLQVPDHLVLGVVLGHVDDRPVVDVLGVVRVLERAERLFEVGVGRGQAGHHHRAGVAAEGILKRDVLRKA